MAADVMFYPVNELKILEKLISNCCMFYEMENLANPQARQAKYVIRNTVAGSRKDCCREK